MEGDKTCDFCGRKKVEHYYVWLHTENRWICPVSFFEEVPNNVAKQNTDIHFPIIRSRKVE